MTLSETGKKEGRKKGKGNSHWVWGFWESRVFPSSTHAGTWNYEKTTIIWNCLFPTHIFCHCISYFNELLGKNWVLRFSFSNPMTSPATTPSESGRWTKQGFTRNTIGRTWIHALGRGLATPAATLLPASIIREKQNKNIMSKYIWLCYNPLVTWHNVNLYHTVFFSWEDQRHRGHLWVISS